MRRLLLFTLSLFSIFIIFLAFAPAKNVSQAAACGAAPLTGSSCSSVAFCTKTGEGTSLGALNCTGGNICCQWNTCETSSSCTAKNYKCGSFTNNCNRTVSCTNTCNSNTQVCSGTKCVAAPACTTYADTTHTAGCKVAGSCTGNFQPSSNCTTQARCCVEVKTVTCASLAPTGYTSSCTTKEICTANGNGTIAGATNCTGTVCCKFASCQPTTGGACTAAGGCCNSTYSCQGGTCKLAPYCSPANTKDCTYGCTPTTTGGTCKAAPPKPDCPVLCQANTAANTSSCVSAQGVPDARNYNCTGTKTLCCVPGNIEPIAPCPTCPGGYTYDSTASTNAKKCYIITDAATNKKSYSTNYTEAPCDPDTQTCYPNGLGCKSNTLDLGPGFTSGQLPCNTKGGNVIPCRTALGDISTNPQSLITKLFAVILSIAGGIAALLIILSAYRLIASQGNPDRVREAQEQLTAAIVGLIFIIFAFSILNFIGVDILNLFGQ